MNAVVVNLLTSVCFFINVYCGPQNFKGAAQRRQLAAEAAERRRLAALANHPAAEESVETPAAEPSAPEADAHEPEVNPPADPSASHGGAEAVYLC
jgi:hypothetical protein